ncbi:discoidin domain-containing protein [Paractinoplanes globisporus]|uniref:Discoidin domain-containing protein n=1 Tax=Paractinoplanes globisporus TaxID=113565 RepID=A0ABW6WB71_9ACTN|nr:discoidin domain-containing protein [Actinoplanes globisporus]
MSITPRLKAGLVALTLGVAATAQLTSSTAAVAAVPAAPAGFTLTWADDFNGAANTGLNTDVWRYDAGAGANFGTGEVETTTTSTANVYQDGAGHLVLKALHTGSDPVAGWTSGRVETQADGWGAPAGGVVRIESSLKQPDVNTGNGLGYWPAYWMVGSPLRIGIPWPGSGEIDVMENINGHDSLFATLHCGTLPTGPCNEYTGIGSGERACAGCKTGYHKYAVEIDRSVSPEQIRYYFDNTNIFTINSTQVDATTWNNAVHHNFTPIYDLAIGGQFPAAFGGGPTAATVSGAHLDIDYLAVYNKPPSAQSTWGTNVAAGKTATASSSESALFGPGNVTDSDPTTRWSSAFSDPQWVQVDLGATYDLNHVSLNWESAAASAYQIQTSTNGTTWSTVATKTGGTSEHVDFAVSGAARYVRVNGTARQSAWGYSLYDLKVWSTGGTSTPPTATLLSQGHPATASSTENAAFTAPNAVDGNTGTRWSSAFSDPQWVQVDLGATHTISQVTLNWEAAYATAYQIQTSANGTTWTTIYSTTAGTGGVQTLNVTGSGRYVRVNGTARATQYGYSLWEFGVYGT